MTPERKLIEAVLHTYAENDPFLLSIMNIDTILTTPSVQTALAEVRGQERAAVVSWLRSRVTCGCGREDCVADYFPLAYAEHIERGDHTNLPAATPKPEPVLRWKGDKLMMGGTTVARIWQGVTCYWFEDMLTKERGGCVDEAEARTAAEQAVRDWLKRAGCV